jgi:hypothetical protein
MLRRLLLLPLLFLVVSCASPVPTEPAPLIGEPQIPSSEIPRVSLEDAKAAFDSGGAVFVDVRAQASWQESHIARALSIPVNEIETRLDELSPDQWIITYCT